MKRGRRRRADDGRQKKTEEIEWISLSDQSRILFGIHSEFQTVRRLPSATKYETPIYRTID